MWKKIAEFLKPRIPVCEVCGNTHGSGSVMIGNVVPHDVIYPGHEYVLFTRDGSARPEVWRLGFLRAENENTTLVFTGAREGQEDDTVILLIPAHEVYSARETGVDKSKRHGGRNAIKEVD